MLTRMSSRRAPSLLALLLASCSAAHATPPSPATPTSAQPPTAAQTPAPADAPAPVQTAPSTFETEILSEHNRVRASVRPAPRTPLPPLVWDESLAELARGWAQRCPSGHRPRNRYGENIYWSGGMPATAQSAVGAWAEEAEYYDYGSTVCTRDGRQSWAECGHYTQVVWRESTRLGCAMRANCPGQLENVVVCNYDPPGNMNASDTSIPRPY
jgi:pathogenesis-related protein 1